MMKVNFKTRNIFRKIYVSAILSAAMAFAAPAAFAAEIVEGEVVEELEGEVTDGIESEIESEMEAIDSIFNGASAASVSTESNDVDDTLSSVADTIEDWLNTSDTTDNNSSSNNGNNSSTNNGNNGGTNNGGTNNGNNGNNINPAKAVSDIIAAGGKEISVPQSTGKESADVQDYLKAIVDSSSDVSLVVPVNGSEINFDNNAVKELCVTSGGNPVSITSEATESETGTTLIININGASGNLGEGGAVVKVTAPKGGKYAKVTCISVTPEEFLGYFMVDEDGTVSFNTKHFSTFLLEARSNVYNVSFDSNGANGSMTPAIVGENDIYTLPECGFAVPAGNNFKGWSVNGSEKKPGDTIVVTSHTVIKALWYVPETSSKTEVVKPANTKNNTVSEKEDESTVKAVESADTGDSANIALWLVIALVTGAALIRGLFACRKHA